MALLASVFLLHTLFRVYQRKAGATASTSVTATARGGA
jgi:hypothetical protein